MDGKHICCSPFFWDTHFHFGSWGGRWWFWLTAGPCGPFRGSVPCLRVNYCGGLFACKPVYDAVVCSATGYMCFLKPYLMYEIGVVTVATVVPVLRCPRVDGCILRFATLLQWLQSSSHSFKIDGMCLTFSGVILIDSSTHTKWRGREHPPAAGESISLLAPEIVIWKSSVLFTSVLFLLSFKAVNAIKTPKEDLECDTNLKQLWECFWHCCILTLGLYLFKNVFKSNWVLNRPPGKISDSIFGFKSKRFCWWSSAKWRFKKRLTSAKGACYPAAHICSLKFRGQSDRSGWSGKGPIHFTWTSHHWDPLYWTVWLVPFGQKSNTKYILSICNTLFTATWVMCFGPEKSICFATWSVICDSDGRWLSPVQ